MSRPFILGLTGSIGMGKSTVAAMFRELGVPVFDADEAVHRLQGPDGKLVPEIEDLFPGTAGPDGIDRQKLGDSVFQNPAAMTQLEAIVHPAVAAERQAFLLEHAGQRLVVFDIPLLFEKQLAKSVDAVAVVSADAETQRRRVLARPGMTPEKFAAILAMQMPDAEKRARADYIIDTGQSHDGTRGEVAELVRNLTA
jgi:dephospho-CoA kinase